MTRTPFHGAKPPGDTPYWLRNGIADQPEIERHMEEHRRRLGMYPGTHLYGRDAYVSKSDLAEERAVTDRLLEDIAASKINAVNALAALQEWRKQHDEA